MNIGELITTLGVDSTPLDEAKNKVYEFGQNYDRMFKEANKKAITNNDIIRQIRLQIVAWEKAMKGATDPKEIDVYKKKLSEANFELGQLEGTAVSVGEKNSNAIQKWIVGMASFAGAIYAAKKGWEAYKTVVSSAGGTHDQFKETMGAIELTTDRFFNILARADFDNFAQKLADAAKAGRDYIKAIDQINERTLGSGLERAYTNPEQTAREEIFRNPNADPVLRQQKINEFKAEAIRLGNQDLAIANALVKAEEDKLIAIDVSTEKIKQLYLTYNSGIIDIQNAETAREKMAEIDKTILEIARETNITEKDKQKALTQLTAEKNNYYNLLSDGEKLYVDLLNENAKVKEDNVIAYLESLAKVKEKEGEVAEVTKNVVRVQSQITNAIEEQNKGLKKQADMDMEFVRRHFQIQRQKNPVELGLGPLEDSIKEMEDLSKLPYTNLPKMELIDTRDQVEKLTKGYMDQRDAVGLLSDSLMGFFESAETGWKNMLDTFSNAINRFLAEQAAKALLKFVLNMIAPGSGAAVNLLPSGGGGGGGMDLLAPITNMAKQNIDISGNLKVDGKDLTYAVRRNA